MWFSWFRNRRRRKLLAQPFPPAWEQILVDNVWHYPALPSVERRRLRDFVTVTLNEKNWEGCAGLPLTDEIRVTIAANAALLTLGWDQYFFPQVLSILVYPTQFAVPTRREEPHGVVWEGPEVKLGEAWVRGPVILAWEETLDCSRGNVTGANLVLHEFAHQLDFANGDVDGLPPLDSPAELERWRRVMRRELHRLERRADRGVPTLLDPYGAEGPEEFFAVATECFFECPADLRFEHAELYEVLRDFYRQDPARRGI